MNESRKAMVEPLWTKNFFLVMGVNFFMFSSMYLLLTTLPGYAAKLGGDEKTAGLIVGLFTISAVLVRPWFGNLLDWKGRKAVLLPGIVLFVLATLAFDWISVVWLLLAIRILHGVGWAAITTGAGTIAADIIPAPRRAEGMGYYGISTTIAMSIGPALGLSIIKDYSFSLLFSIATVIGLAGLLVGFFIQYDGIKGHGKIAGEKGRLLETTSVPPALVLFCISLTYGGIITFLPLYAKSRGIDNIGIFFTVFALILLISRPVIGRLADRFGTGTVVVPAILFIGAGLLSLVNASALGQFLFSGVLYALGFSALQPVLSAVTISLAPPNRRGAANATFFSAMDLGIGMGAIILGFLSEKFGYPAMYGMSVAGPAAALAVYFVLLKKKLVQLHVQGDNR